MGLTLELNQSTKKKQISNDSTSLGDNLASWADKPLLYIYIYM